MRKLQSDPSLSRLIIVSAGVVDSLVDLYQKSNVDEMKHFENIDRGIPDTKSALLGSRYSNEMHQ